MMKCALVILNWNGWKDTLECLESVFRIAGPDVHVVVCDNASTDGSVEKIRDWSQGKLAAVVSSDEMASYSTPRVGKPLRVRELSASDLADPLLHFDNQAQLTLIHTGGNLGFAGGNNVGIRYVLRNPDIGFVWLLNNDTVIDANALDALQKRMLADEQIGICGSTLLFYHQPDTAQAFSGAFHNRWTGLAKYVGSFASAAAVPPIEQVEAQLDYVAGASMFVRRSFLEQVGLMADDYFIYYEEIDWVKRGEKKFRLGFAADSIVYHKEGATIGSSSDTRKTSALSDFYLCRNRLIFTRKFYPYALPTVYCAMALQIIKRLLRRDFNKARVMFAAMLGEKDYARLK